MLESCLNVNFGILCNPFASTLYRMILDSSRVKKHIEDVSKRCKENDKNFHEAVEQTQADYEKRLKTTVKSMEQRYKQQYDELAKLTQGMQEEGRKWRELYYKSVTKD